MAAPDNTWFWEDLSFKLLQMHLNGDALNTTILKQLFVDKPKILEEIDFGDGVTLGNLD